ncbi:MAG: restriction endonuclease [candidate division Zixibacteria bacterium]|nr:restriction endonuclease [Candidatus Tariuqbacter arcticus]
MNKLYYGDNLEILQNSIEDESIDLIYIDPPFNSKRAYNVLFESIDMTDAKAQKEAFKDTWSKVSYLDEKCEIKDLDLDLHRFLDTLDNLRLSKSTVSYLTIMAHRIWYMHKKLKKTGSFYLHCDPTMSHYLKIVCDLIFLHKNFVNELVWCYKERERSKNHYNRKHDIILFYTKQYGKHIFNYQEIMCEYSDITLKKFKYIDNKGRRFRIRGKGTSEAGKWRKKTDIPIEEESEFTYRQYLDETKGTLPRDWFEMPFINQAANERLGYPTQKPEALLERIIEASSNKGDIVADFFCGCGTTVAVAQKLERKWIGADISHLAIRLVYDRLLQPFEDNPKVYKKIIENIEINGFPKDIASAKDLAEKTDKSRLKFQEWIVEIMMNGVSNPKKTADGGYDGYFTFSKSEKEKDVVLIEVKSGRCGVGKLRSFITTVNQEKASFGAFVCFKDNATQDMERLAKQQGYYKPNIWGNRYEKIQIITVEDLLAGKSVSYPLYQNLTFKTATNIPMKTDNDANYLFD